MFEEYQKRVAGTNIDSRSLLCTDYFNHFNEVIMLLNMLADMPDMLDEIDKWEFKSYRDHFSESGLGIGPLAIEAYEFAPANLRERLEKISDQMRMLIIETRAHLRGLLEAGENDQFAHEAKLASMQLQGMVDDGGATIHGYDKSLDQSKVDDLFGCAT